MIKGIKIRNVFRILKVFDRTFKGMRAFFRMFNVFRRTFCLFHRITVENRICLKSKTVDTNYISS
jgi:hypothetical protein